MAGRREFKLPGVVGRRKSAVETFDVWGSDENLGVRIRANFYPRNSPAS